jgi:hypothetical protein
MQVDAYRDQVSSLYHRVESWLAELGIQATVERTSQELREDPSGPYEIESLSLSFPEQRPEVHLIPRGRFIVGALGRVDMKSRHGIERLVLVPRVEMGEGFGTNPEDLRECEWAWGENSLTPQLHTLDQDMFHRLLEVLT